MSYHSTPSTTPPSILKEGKVNDPSVQAPISSVLGPIPSIPGPAPSMHSVPSVPSYDSDPSPSYHSLIRADPSDVVVEERVVFMAPILPHTYYPGQFTPHENVRYVMETPPHTYPPHHPYFIG